jgi:hypothetical protein
MREISREGLIWYVREVDTRHVPGARAHQCLIVEAEGVVRRVWTYPREWDGLSDDELWRVVSVPPHAELRGDPAVVTELTRTLLEEIRGAAEIGDSRDDRHERRRNCIAARRRMQEAVRLYAESLRREGVPPERALVLLKTAVRSGLSNPCNDETAAEEVLHEGVEWCIAAYYAA